MRLLGATLRPPMGVARRMPRAPPRPTSLLNQMHMIAAPSHSVPAPPVQEPSHLELRYTEYLCKCGGPVDHTITVISAPRWPHCQATVSGLLRLAILRFHSRFVHGKPPGATTRQRSSRLQFAGPLQSCEQYMSAAACRSAHDFAPSPPLSESPTVHTFHSNLSGASPMWCGTSAYRLAGLRNCKSSPACVQSTSTPSWN